MNLQGERRLPAPIELAWTALNDPQALKACITGCESLDLTGDNEYTAVLGVRIGPVNARFKGRLRLLNIQAPTSYTIEFDGQGGVAGFGKGSADVSLRAEGAETVLRYAAKAQVGGKIAQIGSRLVDSAAEKIAGEFFAAFENYLKAQQAQAASAAAEAETPAAAPADAASAAAPAAQIATAPAVSNALPWPWLIGGAVVLVAAAWLLAG
jgi:carbon monoxide dehydrogenase subunit G